MTKTNQNHAGLCLTTMLACKTKCSCMYRTYLTLFFLISFYPFTMTITLKHLRSPCPDIFKYLNYNSIDRSWYGELSTIFDKPDFDWIDILMTFDTPPQYFAASYGSILKIDQTTYSISVKLEEKLKTQVSIKIRFYVVHENLKLPPKLVSIQLNSEQVCNSLNLLNDDHISLFNENHTDTHGPNNTLSSEFSKIYNLEDFRFVVTYRDEASEAECYDVVEYEGNYATLTMLSEKNTDEPHGVWMRLTFDAPVELRSSYGNVTRIDDRTYVVQNFDDQLIGDKPKRVRFAMEYDRSKPKPNLVSFLHAGTQVCNPYFFKNSVVILAVRHGGQDQTNRKVKTVKTQKLSSQVPDALEDKVFPSDIFQNLESRNYSTTSGNDISCGTVAGGLLHEGEFPWHVALYYLRGVDWKYICGASLISKSFVITAAHCATNSRRTTSLNAKNLIAYLGKHYLSQNSKETIQGKRIAEIIIHPNYNSNNLSNDIALLKLALPAEYNDYVRPVCLWQDSNNLNEILNIPGNVVGWGSDETGNFSDQLMKAFMPVVSLEICLDSFRDFYGKFLTSNNYCAGFKNGTSVCSGDSGGGMVFPKSNSNPKYPIWQLRGLVSLGPTLQSVDFKCDTSNYVIFTDIAKYLDWIQNIIN